MGLWEEMRSTLSTKAVFKGFFKCFCTCFGVFQPNFFLFQRRPDSLKATRSSVLSFCWAASFCLELIKTGRISNKQMEFVHFMLLTAFNMTGRTSRRADFV